MSMTAERITEARAAGLLTITPYAPEQLSGASYDVRLYPKLLVYTEPVLDLKRRNPTREIDIPETGYTLVPGEFYLGSTVECIELVGVEAVLDGKSTTGRLSMRVHATAGYLDPGFRGQVTCEIDVVRALTVYPYMLFGQLRFAVPDGPIRKYRGKYQDQAGPVASRSWMDYLDRP